MSASEQPVSPAVEEEVRSEASDKTLLLRDTLIAGGALVVSILALALYFAFFSQSKEEKIAGREISAAEWVGQPTGEPPTEPAKAASAESPDPETKDETYAPPPEEDAPVVLDGGSSGQRHGTVQSGVPVITSLQKLGLSVQQAHAIITALDGVYDFRKSRPGESFELEVGNTGEPEYFAYHVSLTEVYEVTRNGDALKGRRKKIETDRETVKYGGTIASSLYKTMSELEAHPSLAGKIVDVLANQVDFYKEQRPGDTFRVIVEAESLKGEFLRYGPVLALEYNGVKAGKKRFFWFAPTGQRGAFYNTKGISQPRSVISIPLHYTRLSSRFGTRYHPILKRKKFHNGVDFAAGMGAPVWACSEGEVTLAAKRGANGNLVIIRHEDNLQSIYAHLQRFASGIRAGVKVRERQVIGYVGSTGRSTGPHLHFGLKKGSTFIDPLKYKVQPGRPVAARYRGKLKSIISDMGQRLDHTKIVPPSEPLAEASDNEDEVLGVEDW